MKFGFFRKLKNYGLLCCGCRYRFTRGEAVYYHDNTCICRSCFDSLDAVDGGIKFFSAEFNVETFSPFYYKGLYRKIFKRFKFNGMTAYGHILGMAAADRLKHETELTALDCIVPVPVSAQRLRERGYNQSEIMAEPLSLSIDIPIEKLLTRIRHSNPNSISSGSNRLLNVKNAYKAAPAAAGKRILLLDDVQTTGSTMYECRRTLYEAGAAEVHCVTSAYVYRKPKPFI